MRFALAMTLLSVCAPSPAAADNCVPREQVAVTGGHPCMDVSSSFGRLSQVIHGTPEGSVRLELHVGGPRMMMLSNAGSVPRSIGVELFRWDQQGAWIGLENWDAGDRTYGGLIGIRYQRDARHWGAHAGGWVVMDWMGGKRVLAPFAGVRFGRFDRAAVLVEALAGGAALYSGSPRGLELDIDARATWAVLPALRLELRGRHRDMGTGPGRWRELWLAAGVEAAVAGKDGFRVMPVFAGIGVRAATREPLEHPELLHEVTPSAAPGWQLLAVVDIDLAIHSSRASWY